MKKNQVDAIFNIQAERRRRIFTFLCLIVALFIITLTLFIGYIKNNKGYFVHYKENSNVDYKVYLKENTFFENDYLDSDNRYIASLIDYIKANFQYEMNMEEQDVNFDYSYRIEAEVSVTEPTSSKPLFTRKYEIVKPVTKIASGQSKVVIDEDVNINYNDYNDLVQKFVTVYGLNDADSTLTLNMYIDVKGSCEKFTEDSNDTTVISLVIPLTTKTVGIDIKNNLVESNNNVMLCKDKSSFIQFNLILAILTFAIMIYLIYLLIKYINDTRTAQTVYSDELKKILNNYHSYIQKVKNNISLTENKILVDGISLYKDCQVFKLNTFTDMLEIRDSLNTPIIMSSNESNATYFIIIDAHNKAIYVYELKVIKNKKKKK